MGAETIRPPLRASAFIAIVCLVVVGGMAKCGFAEFRTVARVVDGDTLVLDRGERVRLIGVDTPETKDPRKPVQFFGREAANFTRQMVEGKRVRLEFDQANAATGHKDKYGRTLGYVFREDGKFLNAEIVRLGFGHAYMRYPFEHAHEFRELERQARSNNAGLWNDPTLPRDKSSSTAEARDAVYLGPRGGAYHYNAEGRKIYDPRTSR